jgi:glycosyltransferase involved in cell wall biosynthesis
MIKHALPKVLILLSTYNGEKYLRAQLNSLKVQKGVELHLLIRDDGSRDNTVSIIKEFETKFKKIILLEEKNIGCKYSFLKLLSVAYSLKEKFEFYAFCDQDDIWLEDKLQSAVHKLNSFDEDIPMIYIGQTQLVDSELNIIETTPLNMNCSFGESMVIYGATGCTEVFNYKLLEILVSKSPTFFTMHDAWAYQVCLAVGGSAILDSEPHILYRQHNNNVLGGKSSFYKTWKRRIYDIFVNRDNERSKTAESILIDFETILTKKNKELLNQTFAYRQSLKKRLYLIFNKDLMSKNKRQNISFKIAVILGTY